jgi:L-ascorbate metabolism protein UlaG (beta-lactamase superfamily)
MYHKDRSPVGELTIDGTQARDAVTQDGPGNFHLKPNGVFWTSLDDDGVRGAHVSTTESFLVAAHFIRNATQSGPMLVIDGNIHPKFLKDADSRKYRNGVGVRDDGSSVFAISDQPVTFFEFATFMRDDMETPNALYLDGTISRLHAPGLARSNGGAAMGPIVGVVAKAEEGRATYIANEGVMVSSGALQILFDPLMQDDLGTYQSPPPALLAALKAGEAPYDGVDAVFVSHAHTDHFSAEAMNAYLSRFETVRLFAPAQAVALMKSAPGWSPAFDARVNPAALDPGETIAFGVADATILGVRIPHAGGSRTADVENIAWRVAAPKGASVIHLGDGEGTAADVARAPELAAARTSLVLAPFWVAATNEDAAALAGRLNADGVIAIHTPADIPPDLAASGADYFSTPGETRAINAVKDNAQ